MSDVCVTLCKLVIFNAGALDDNKKGLLNCADYYSWLNLKIFFGAPMYDFNTDRLPDFKGLVNIL